MLKTAAKIISFFLIYLMIFIVMKPVFMIVYHGTIGNLQVSDWWDVIYHGLAMDCSVAGYFTIIPALTVIAETITKSRLINIIRKSYIAVSAVLIAVVYVLDIVLYGYWNFRLDATPLFYFWSSPASAMASASFGQIILAIVSIALIAVLIYIVIDKTAGRIKLTRRISWLNTACAVVLTAALILPVRGSLTVSTMNLSRSYYSENQRLNHAAINPAFSLMYSLTHQNNFKNQFRFFDEADAADIVGNLLPHNTVGAKTDSLIARERPDVYIIILESFSNHLLPTLGGEAIATGLDSIARTGLVFTNFYASGARTDRAIPAVISAFPAQPTTSLMKFTKKIEHVPSVAKQLKLLGGYDTNYYYGGDANFTNMLAFLISSGFDNVVSDKDFPISRRTGKWGAHDGVLFEKVLRDVEQSDTIRPSLRVIQTSSSHEPFEVPYSDKRFADDIRKNAFAYADSCVTTFVDSLYASGRWDNSLIFITADHYGVYPRNIDDIAQRHRVPLIITGGALNAAPNEIDTYGDQTAIAATLLAMLGLDSPEQTFSYSRNLLDRQAPQFAFFSEPGFAAYADSTGTAVINLDNDAAVIQSSGVNADSAAIRAKAILQTIYTSLSEL